MTEQSTLEYVQAAAGMVSLPLSEDHATEIAALLQQWIPDAIALSKRMQSCELDFIAPVTTFTMPIAGPADSQETDK